MRVATRDWNWWPQVDAAWLFTGSEVQPRLMLMVDWLRWRWVLEVSDG